MQHPGVKAKGKVFTSTVMTVTAGGVGSCPLPPEGGPILTLSTCGPGGLGSGTTTWGLLTPWSQVNVNGDRCESLSSTLVPPSPHPTHPSLTTVLPRKVFPPPHTCLVSGQPIGGGSDGACQCEVKCLGCTCLWFSFVFKKQKEINLKIICHHKNETKIKIFIARRGHLCVCFLLGGGRSGGVGFGGFTEGSPPAPSRFQCMSCDGHSGPGFDVGPAAPASGWSPSCQPSMGLVGVAEWDWAASLVYKQNTVWERLSAGPLGQVLSEACPSGNRLCLPALQGSWGSTPWIVSASAWRSTVQSGLGDVRLMPPVEDARGGRISAGLHTQSQEPPRPPLCSRCPLVWPRWF